MKLQVERVRKALGSAVTVALGVGTVAVTKELHPLVTLGVTAGITLLVAVVTYLVPNVLGEEELQELLAEAVRKGRR